MLSWLKKQKTWHHFIFIFLRLGLGDYTSHFNDSSIVPIVFFYGNKSLVKPASINEYLVIVSMSCLKHGKFNQLRINCLSVFNWLCKKGQWLNLILLPATDRRTHCRPEVFCIWLIHYIMIGFIIVHDT